MMTLDSTEFDLKTLANRKDLWPKEITLMKTLSYSQGKTFYLGTKQPLLEISPTEIVFGDGKNRYRLDPIYTNLSLLIDETALLQSPPSSPSNPSALNPTQMEGPDFTFLLNTKVEFSEADRAKAIDLLLTQGGYFKVAAQIRQALYEAYESSGANSIEWTDRLYFARICSILGEKESNLKKEDSLFDNNADAPFYKRFKPESLRFFLSSPPALTKALLIQKSEDDLIGLFSVLDSLFQTYSTQVNDYSSLAAAFAIVYDQPLPKRWPHGQVNHALVPLLNDKQWIPLFAYFQKKDQENALAVKIKEMSASELKFVVDCPIEISELEWALKEQRNGRSTFDKTYFDVQYDEPRIKGREVQYSWPHEENYTLAMIKKKGGICIDQSYFAALCAKAFAIPSISISGEGSNCAHAWLGFMPSGDKWNMKGGRYEANNYVVGFAWDPQTWNQINDHELEYISQRYSDSKEYEQSQGYLMFAELGAEVFTKEQLAKILLESKTICLKNPEPWFKLEKQYKIAAQNEDLKTLYTEMLEQFSSQKDWKTRAQEGLSKTAGGSESGDSNSTDAATKIMNENRGKRADLAIQIASKDAFQKIQNDHYEEAFTVYQTIIKKFGKESGLMIINELVEPFIALSISKQQLELKDKALKAAEKLIDNTEREASLNQSKQRLDKLQKEIEEALKVK